VDLVKETRRRRTFAIISHPDAGKTTLTEKLLLYGGAIQMAGSVRARRNQRRATSDWMAIEQERGISVTSTVLQFEYQGCRCNLLDTPGHQDFSEDTYRTLMAADAAIMLIDAGKGVEPQTEKLYAVCKLRKIPIFTFINKMDRPALEPLQLLDEIEAKLGLATWPANWPIGNGPSFCGVYDRMGGGLHLFDRQEGGAKAALVRLSNLDDPALPQQIGPQATQNLREELALIEQLGIGYVPELVTSGDLSPVFFGSAMTNFGVQQLLDRFLELGPCPGPRQATGAEGGLVRPEDELFSAFVFKTQANMDPHHRDRVAFFRICSGAFSEGMEVVNARSGKVLRLSKPREFFGRERETAEEGFAGDVLGIVHSGAVLIGDTLHSPLPGGGHLRFSGMPRFSPEHFGVLRAASPAHRKSFVKGLAELLEEGAVQGLRDAEAMGNDLILAAVGPLQFEVMQYRLRAEYGADTNLEMMPYHLARWISGEKVDQDELAASTAVRCVQDLQGRLVALFRDPWSMEHIVQKHPKLVFSSVAIVD
jgi:peptide chain release factor 3